MGHSQLRLSGLICIGMLIVSCATAKRVKEQERLLPDKTSFVRFWIEQLEGRKKGIWISTNIQNVSSRIIKVHDPIHFFISKPILTDSMGDSVMQRIEILPDYSIDFKTIDKGSICQSTFGYSLDDYFHLERGRSYELKFIYRSGIFNENNEVIANGKDLASNTIVIRLE